jgi:nucleotide sugar dehydrogenase
MKHIIIGTGIIGRATGELLEAHKQDVIYNDKDADLIVKLSNENKKIDLNIKNNYDLYWICTAEWHVDDVLKTIKDKKRKVIIRATIKPHELEQYQEKYPKLQLVHVPEFLCQKTAIDDIFKPDRIIIGTNDIEMEKILNKVLQDCLTTKIYCTPQESSLIKLTANAWLAMQISFWNEIKKLSDHFDDVNPQLVANAVTLDHRISRYGSNMIGKPYQGFCFPKDTKSLEKVFKYAGIKQNIISSLIKTNEEMKCQS